MQYFDLDNLSSYLYQQYYSIVSTRLRAFTSIWSVGITGNIPSNKFSAIIPRQLYRKHIIYSILPLIPLNLMIGYEQKVCYTSISRDFCRSCCILLHYMSNGKLRKAGSTDATFAVRKACMQKSTFCRTVHSSS